MHPIKHFFVNDIFYVAKACITMHTMMVEHHMENDQEESELL